MDNLLGRLGFLFCNCLLDRVCDLRFPSQVVEASLSREEGQTVCYPDPVKNLGVFCLSLVFVVVYLIRLYNNFDILIAELDTGNNPIQPHYGLQSIVIPTGLHILLYHVFH